VDEVISQFLQFLPLVIQMLKLPAQTNVN
jgi:hypothetical protein